MCKCLTIFPVAVLGSNRTIFLGTAGILNDACVGFHRLNLIRWIWGTRRFMDLNELRARQAPLKDRYREQPEAAAQVMRASGVVNADGLTCTVGTIVGDVVAGLHPAAGGLGGEACSGDMLLQALVACAGVTLAAVAKALGVELTSARVEAEGDLDFRGTLGVGKEVAVGFTAIRLKFLLETSAADDQLANVLRLTERYCVILQTLKQTPALASRIERV